ncbi:MAG: C25 family cysteine peptidase [Candidatus Eisenbacteria bacterium]|nr:C25 family cysteine peptidase [Candidatus Eisenbacteria bacterium]
MLDSPCPPGRKPVLIQLIALTIGLLTSLASFANPGPLRLDRRLSPDDVTIDSRANVPVIRMKGETFRALAGGTWPEALTWFALPPGQVAEKVTVTADDPVDIEEVTALDLAPLLEGLPRVGAPLSIRRAEGNSRGVRLLGLGVSPLAWDAARGRLVLYQRLEFTVDLAPEPAPAAALTPGRPGSPGDNRFRDALRGLVANPGLIVDGIPPAAEQLRGDFAPSSFVDDAWEGPFRPSLDGRPVDMVIITGEALESEYQRLAEWRTRSGIYTVIRTVEWIAAEYPEGVDLADRIRRFIRDAVSGWGVEWVLLGGDADVVPVRYGRNQYFGGEDIPADIYYQCLDRTWNENGNDDFGEGAPPGDGTLPADNADLIPDVWLARIPCSSAEGTRLMIDKTFQYERTPILAPGYLDRFVSMAEVLQPSNWNFPDTVVFDGALLSEELIAGLSPFYQIDRFYENWRAYQQVGAMPETRDAVLAAMSAGAAIVNHDGHGFHNNLSVGIGGLEVVRTDVDALANVGRPFLFFGINCNSAAIDFDCIAEHFLCQPNGAFAYMGSTRFDFPGTGDLYQSEFIENLMDGVPLGKAHALAKLAEVPLAQFDGPERWHQFSLLCLADPAVPIYSDLPRSLSVMHASSLTLGQPVPVTVTRLGAPLAGARVTLYRAGEVFITATTDVNGQVTLECAAETPGPLSLVVTARNSLPYEATPMLGLPAAAAWPVIRSIRVDDMASGNGNGRLEAGETADLLITVRNDGSAPAANLGLSIGTTTAAVSFPSATGLLGTLAAGASDSTWDGAPIRVAVEAGVPGWLDVESLVTLSWTGGSRVIPVGLRVGGAVLAVRSQSYVDDPGGPASDGVVLANELIHLTPVIVNQGGARTGSVIVRLESVDPRVTLETAQVVVGPLEAGQALALPVPLAFRVSDLQALPTIDLVLSIGSPEYGRRAVDLKPPGVPPIPFGLSRPSSILLTWFPVLDPDIRGYAIYRSASESGPFDLLNPDVDNAMGYYEDINLPPFSRWFYRVASMDRSGNQSGTSATVNFATSYPTLGNWPIRREGATPSSPVVHDFDGDGILEIIIGGEEIYVVRADGTEYRNGDDDSRTLGILTRTNKANFWSTPAVADVDGDGILDIVAAGFNDGKLYVFGSDGSTRAGWPRALGNPLGQSDAAVAWGSPLIVDLTNDGSREIIIPGNRYLFAFHADGTEVSDGDSNPATYGPWLDLGGAFNYGTAAAADFDQDGRPEIAVGSRSGQFFLIDDTGIVMPGFPKVYPGAQITGSPAIADLDKDGELEAIFPLRNTAEIHAVNRFGASPPGWPVRIAVNQDLDASPTVADLDGDTFPDVVMVGGSGRVSIWKGQNGVIFPGFPVNLALLEQAQSFAVRGTPCLGDVTGDGVPDILIGTQTASVYGLSTSGQVLPGFPLRAEDNIEGGPLLWDIDGDGNTNIVFGSIDRKIYAYDTPGLFNPISCPWPMFRHDQMNTGFVGKPLSVPAEPALSNLTALATLEGIRLEWSLSGDGWTGWVVERFPAALPEAAERLTVEALPHRTGTMTYLDGTARPGDRYAYRLSVIDRLGHVRTFPELLASIPAGAPRALAGSAAPNPFGAGTTLSYAIAEGPTKVTLDVFDPLGRRIRRVESIDRAPGTYSTVWDGRDDSGAEVLPGVYYWRLTAGPDQVRGKLTRIR